MAFRATRSLDFIYELIDFNYEMICYKNVASLCQSIKKRVLIIECF